MKYILDELMSEVNNGFEPALVFSDLMGEMMSTIPEREVMSLSIEVSPGQCKEYCDR